MRSPRPEVPPHTAATTDDAVLGGRLKLLQPAEGHRAGHYRLGPVAPVCVQYSRNHEDERSQYHGQIQLPMRLQAQPRAHYERRHHDEHRVENDVQGENAGVQAQQLGMQDTTRRAPSFIPFTRKNRRIGDLRFHDPYRCERQQSGEGEEPLHADRLV